MSKLELTSARRSVGIRGKRTRLTITGTLMVVMVMSMIIPLSGAGAHNGTAVQQSVLSIPSNVLDQNQDTWPTNLTARLVDDGILLNWEAPVEDAASVTGYEILRMRPSKEESDLTALVANTDSTGTTYTDATATEAGSTVPLCGESGAGEPKERRIQPRFRRRPGVQLCGGGL